MFKLESNCRDSIQYSYSIILRIPSEVDISEKWGTHSSYPSEASIRNWRYLVPVMPEWQVSTNTVIHTVHTNVGHISDFRTLIAIRLHFDKWLKTLFGSYKANFRHFGTLTVSWHYCSTTCLNVYFAATFKVGSLPEQVMTLAEKSNFEHN